ncbi:hypothetical protein EDB19DRAFT_1906447 [Suillus lakei]|nr:hypothetical protein EDB19DRAFT_1906447 [Suillus lakei]
MYIDPPSNHSTAGTSGCVLDMNIDIADNETRDLAVVLPADTPMVGVTSNVTSNQAIEYQSLRKRKFAWCLHNTAKNCIERHCKMGHPTTEYLRMHINKMLQAALEGIEVEEIMLSCDLKAASPANRNADGKLEDSLITTDDDLIPPAGTHIFNSVKCGLLCLGMALSPKSGASGMTYQTGVLKMFKKEATADKRKLGSPPGMPGAYPTVSEAGDTRVIPDR